MKEISSSMLKAMQLAAVGYAGCVSPEAGAKPPGSKEHRAPEFSPEVKKQLSILRHLQGNKAERAAAADQLGKLGDPSAVGPLILVRRNLDDELRAHVAKALEKLKATEVLTKTLGDPNPEIRKESAALLEAWADPKASTALRSALKDPDATVREAVTAALGNCGGKEDVPHLIERLEKDTESDVRSAAAQALGSMADPRAEQALQKAKETESDGFVKTFINMALQEHAARRSK